MLQTAQSDSKSILSEFLQQQVVIFGYQPVRSQLSDIHGLKFDHAGVVQSFDGDAQAVLQDIVKRLSLLSEYAVKHSLDSIIAVHQNKVPSPADLSHLPSSEQNIIDRIPSSDKSQSTE